MFGNYFIHYLCSKDNIRGCDVENFSLALWSWVLDWMHGHEHISCPAFLTWRPVDSYNYEYKLTNFHMILCFKENYSNVGIGCDVVYIP